MIHNQNHKKLVLIELNEINFEYLKKYLSQHPKELASFKNYFESHYEFITSSEKDYVNLEPWIQWVSAHTGMKFSEHKVFRLGEMVDFNHEQIFEKIEKKGYRVGCISPMNSKNDLKNPAYFIPDPWTKTSSSNDFWSRSLKDLLVQTVNDNAQAKISVKSMFILLLTVLRFSRLKSYPLLIKLVISSINKKWNKALFLDMLLNEIHLNFLKSKKPNFSTIFFNAGAHIQHHYFHNSRHSNRDSKNPAWYAEQKHDPIFDMLKVYDYILGSYGDLYPTIVATGLSQVPHDEPIFYYRLKNHCNFFEKLGLNFETILPRMTRDFLATFKNFDDLDQAKKLLESLKIKRTNTHIFEEIEAKELSLFITLTYPMEIEKKDIVIGDNQKEIKLSEDVVFVAIKNGKHSAKGTIMLPKKDFEIPNNEQHVSCLFNLIDSYF